VVAAESTNLRRHGDIVGRAAADQHGSSLPRQVLEVLTHLANTPGGLLATV
jgi:hypothetical protein